MPMVLHEESTMDSPLSDAELIVRTLAGAPSDFGLLVKRYEKLVFNLLYRLIRDRTEAEDLSQETFIRAYQALGSFDRTKPFKPWVLRIAANLAINRIKQAKPVSFGELLQDEGPDYEIADDKLEPERLIYTKELEEKLHSAILALPPTYRLTFTLRYLQDHSIEEIAQITELPVNTVKTHLFRAREVLKKTLRALKPERVGRCK
jgi:RNA polymerase sigma-70 factor (ECF subfamily)